MTMPPGIQSPSQMDLLAKHNPNRPVFVEGPHPLWLRKTCVYYYVLRADPALPDEKVGRSSLTIRPLYICYHVIKTHAFLRCIIRANARVNTKPICRKFF